MTLELTYATPSAIGRVKVELDVPCSQGLGPQLEVPVDELEVVAVASRAITTRSGIAKSIINSILSGVEVQPGNAKIQSSTCARGSMSTLGERETFQLWLLINRRWLRPRIWVRYEEDESEGAAKQMSMNARNRIVVYSQ